MGTWHQQTLTRILGEGGQLHNQLSYGSLVSEGLSLLMYKAQLNSMDKGLLTQKGISAVTACQRASDCSYASWKLPHVLTVAGSDSGAGAGVQADMKACGALGVYCSTVITAVTAQNTLGVQGIHVIPYDIVVSQMDSVLSDMEVDVVKTGMLPSADMISALSEKLQSYGIKGLVVDPVMVATSGDRLAGDEILEALCKHLLPMTDIVTPNLAEASALLGGRNVRTVADMREVAKAIKKFGPRYVLIKGGHLDNSDDVVDVLYDGDSFRELHGKRVQTRNTHGTGCTLASTIAAEMAKGARVPEAVQAAKHYLQEALQESERLSMGKGPQGPLNHLFKLQASNGQLPRVGLTPSHLRLYAVTDSGFDKRWRRSTSDSVRAAIEGGATMIQIREKEAESGDFFKEALSCVEVARGSGVPIVINDRLDIAMACNADGVHLGQTDLPVSRARALLGPNKIIGASCKTVEQAQKAFEDGADYIGCGGVYPTSTKKNNRTIGLEGLHTVCMASPLPVVAIGGISAANVEDVFEGWPPNLHGVAVVSALFDKPDVLKETQELASILAGIFSS